MIFRTRSKELVISDLSAKLDQLPSSHPEVATLARMIRDLTVELTLAATPKKIGGPGPLGRPAGDPGSEDRTTKKRREIY